MKRIKDNRAASVELEEALADYLEFGMVNGGHNLFSDILPRICSLEQANEILARHADELSGRKPATSEKKEMPATQNSAKEEQDNVIALGVFDTVLMVALAFFFSLSMLQHFYALG